MLTTIAVVMAFIFVLLGLVLFYRAATQSRGRARFTTSGIGSVLVGIGNLLMLRSVVLGILCVAIGFVLIAGARNVLRESDCRPTASDSDLE